MKIQKRLNLALEAGTQYIELAQMYEAATTEDKTKLEKFRNDPSRAIRFATFCNPNLEISISDLSKESFIKFAAVFNPSTSTEVLDEIGLNQSSINPVIPEAIHNHKNASKEFQVFRTLEGRNVDNENYEYENEKFFIEAIYDSGDGNWFYGQAKKDIELEDLESLLYLYILGFIEASQPETEFWTYVYDDPESEVIVKNLELFGSLPAIPKSLYDQCDAIVGARCIAGALTSNQELMRSLIWDNNCIWTGVGGNWWQDSRSPRSSVASNALADEELLRLIFEEESANEVGLGEFPHPVFWRLSCNQFTPQDVLSGIITLIENNKIDDEMTQEELLVGHSDDFPFGLATNPSIKGELRARVEKLMRERNLNPDDYEEM
jgi:hypothetical protein